MRLKRHDASSSLALISHAAESTYEKKSPPEAAKLGCFSQWCR